MQASKHLGAGRLGIGGLLAVALLTGCTQPPPEFTENLLVATTAELVPPHREQIAAVLARQFGTPDEPHAPQGSRLNIEQLRAASGPAGYVRDEADEEYLQRGLYRQHCASCHGITGDGAGPAAEVLSPYPRDFRPGVFKFKSTYLAAKPTDDDLRRILIHGIPGTAMPSFALLDENQIDALVEYVKYLAIRGQVERELMEMVSDEFDFDPVTSTTNDPLDPEQDAADRQRVEETIDAVAHQWSVANRQVVQPHPEFVPSTGRSAVEVAESASQGRVLFASTRAKCTDCHGPLGEAVITKDFDNWNDEVVKFLAKIDSLSASIATRQSQLAALSPGQRERGQQMLAVDRDRLARWQQVAASLLPPQLARPRSLAEGVFHGGGRPIDLFRRIHQGIAGTPMPGHGPPRPGAAGALSEAEIWQLVDFVRSLSTSEAL